MQNDDEGDAKAGELGVALRAGGDGGGQRQSVQQRVQRQAQRRADPGKLFGGFVRQRVRVFTVSSWLCACVSWSQQSSGSPSGKS